MVLFSLRCLIVFLVGVFALPALVRAELPLPDNFSYTVRLLLPLHEKSYLGSGFYLNYGESIYLVTARHVLFASTQVRIKDGATFAIPRHLLHRIRYLRTSKLLTLDGVLSEKEKDGMLRHPSTNGSGKQAIQYLHEKSQQLALKAHVATVVTCTPGTGELELRLTAMLIKGLVKYHPAYDMAVIKLGGPNGFVPEVRVRKSEKLTALSATDLKLMRDVVPGSRVLVLGSTYAGQQEASLKVKQPIPVKGTVAGKNKEFGMIALDCPANPGDSGGLVLQVEGESDEKNAKAIGVMSGGFNYEKNRQNSKRYSLAVPLDALMELLHQ